MMTSLSSLVKGTSRSIMNKTALNCGDSVKLFLIHFRPMFRSSPSELFLGKGGLKICSKFTGKHPCRSAISMNLQSNFIEIAPRHDCSPLNLQHVFRTPFPKNTFERLLPNV